MSNYISYSSILKDRSNFLKSGTKSGSEFNLFDTPSHKYFKIFFYFNNGDSDGNTSIESSNGLLTPTWLLSNDILNDSTYYLYNSAWSYLKMNNEDERADLLIDFVNLLSNINSESPWYFAEVVGLDAALERKTGSDNLSIEAVRPKLMIKCIQDSYDDRIGTLLDLYRAITWSWTTKRAILPANLRKFDMGIMIFETPNKPFHTMGNNKYASVGEGSTEYVTSYKYIEFHNCEFEYNSTKSGYSSLDNRGGYSPEYMIEIHFDDCYETRYNEFLMKKIGDLIEFDTLSGLQIADYTYEKLSTTEKETELQSRINAYEKSFMDTALGQLKQAAVGSVESLLQKAVLGNLYTFSLTKLNDQTKALVQGGILNSARHVAEYLRDAKQRKDNNINNLNLFENMGITKKNVPFPTTNQIGNISNNAIRINNRDNIENMGTLATKKRIVPKVKYIGNLHEGNTIANNL